MKKDQRYQRIEQAGEDNDAGRSRNGSPTRNSSSPYRDDPSEPSPSTGGNPPIGKVAMQRARSTPTGGQSASALEGHPLDQQQPSSLRNDFGDTNSTKLRMRRGTSKDAMSPAGSRSGSLRKLPMSRESSSENIVMLEGNLEASFERINRNENGNTSGQFATPPRPIRHAHDKDSNREASSAASSVHGEDNDCDRGDGGSRGGDGDGDGLLCVSHGSSFDLLDDDDEINLQRYNRDFGVSPYISNIRTGDLGWDDEGGAENVLGMYHPRSDTDGSTSKDPWIRMVQQNNPQSPTSGNVQLSSVHSISDFLLYLQGVRRQARQRRAQRLLTMPSEQGWQRFQFWLGFYCWDATDVGLLVIGILLVIWFAGLLWLARINMRNAHASDRGDQNGAEYNNNAEFDDYEEGGSPLYILFQWLWWALGFVLLVRILGPFAVQNVNNRRRERRRQRYMSGDMQQQQQRMHQQQMPTMVNAAYSDEDCAASQDDSIAGLEITEKNSTGDRSPPFTPEPSSTSSLDGMDIP